VITAVSKRIKHNIIYRDVLETAVNRPFRAVLLRE